MKAFSSSLLRRRVSRKIRAGFTLGLLSAVAVCGHVRGSNLWDGGGADGNWSTATNWSDDVVPAANATTGAVAALTFAGTLQTTANNDLFPALTTVGGLAFSAGAGAFTLTGNSITLGGNVTNSSASLQTIGMAVDLGTATRTITMTTGGGNVAFTGNISSTAAASGLTLAGTGSLTLSGNNTYTGSTTIAAATQTLIVGSNTALGDATSSTLIVNGGTIQAGGGARTIANTVRLGGASTYSGSNNLTFTGNFNNFVTGAGAITNNNTAVTTFGTTASTFNARADATAGGRTLTFNGSGTTVVPAAITSGTNDGTANAITLNYSGTGNLVLSGANTYAGPTSISAGGTLLLNGSLTSTATALTTVATTLTVNGTFGGTGTFAPNATSRTVTVNAGGRIAPGDSTLAAAAQTGVLTITAPVTFASTATTQSTFAVQLGGNTAGNGVGHYDQLNVAGALTLGTNVGLNLSLVNGYNPAAGDVLYILARDGTAAFTNLFAGTTEGSTVTIAPGVTGQITYLANWQGTDANSSLFGGNDVALYNLTAVPEPSTWAMGMLLVGACAWGVRRRTAGCA